MTSYIPKGPNEIRSEIKGRGPIPTPMRCGGCGELLLFAKGGVVSGAATIQADSGAMAQAQRVHRCQ